MWNCRLQLDRAATERDSTLGSGGVGVPCVFMRRTVCQLKGRTHGLDT